jgi:hypothetical protein
VFNKGTHLRTERTVRAVSGIRDACWLINGVIRSAYVIGCGDMDGRDGRLDSCSGLSGLSLFVSLLVVGKSDCFSGTACEGAMADTRGAFGAEIENRVSAGSHLGFISVWARRESAIR